MDVKRALLADARRTTPTIETAIAGDAKLAAMRVQLNAGNDQLAKAFGEVAAPAGLSDRIILRVRYRQRSKWAAGIAASVVAVALTLVALRPETSSPIAVAMLDHVVEETGELADNGNVSAQTVATSLGRLGVGFRDAGYHIRHLSECVVAGRTGRHLVMNTPKGLVSFLILPTMNGEVGTRHEMKKGATQAVFVAAARPGAQALPSVAIGAFADKNIDPKAMEAMLHQMFPTAGEA
jgi:hypothetical protein